MNICLFKWEKLLYGRPHHQKSEKAINNYFRLKLPDCDLKPSNRKSEKFAIAIGKSRNLYYDIYVPFENFRCDWYMIFITFEEFKIGKYYNISQGVKSPIVRWYSIANQMNIGWWFGFKYMSVTQREHLRAIRDQ